MRWLLLALVLAVVPAEAHAAPRALTPIDEETGFALAGETALVARPVGRSLQVFNYPLTGGAASAVFSVASPPGKYPDGRRLAASAQRAALTVTFGELSSDVEDIQAFGGPPAGPWAPLTELTTPQGTFPFSHEVDGDRLFTTEARGGLTTLAVVVHDPDPHDVANVSPEEALFSTFAGDLVAVTNRRDDLIVRDWRTGVEHSRTKLPSAVEAIALRPDGRVAVTTENDQLYERRPGAPLRRLSRDARRPLAYAGDHLLFANQYDQPRVVEPSGRIRRFGPPTETFDGFETEGEQVLWVANGCLLVDQVTAPPSAAPGKGPCPRSELALDDAQPNPNLARTIPVVLRCIAAPGACRGTVRLTAAKTPGVHVHTLGRPQRFVIRAGQRKRIQVPLTERGYRILRRYVAADDGALVAVTTRGDDGASLPPNRAGGLLVLPRGVS